MARKIASAGASGRIRSGSDVRSEMQGAAGTHDAGRVSGRRATILVVGDTAVRQTLDLLSELSPGTLIGYANSGSEAQVVAAQRRPEIVLLDVRLPDMLAPRAIKLVRLAAPSAKIIAFGWRADHAALVKALAAGADGCVLKDACEVVLVETLWLLGVGRAAVTPERRRVERSNSKVSGQSPLTARENEVLRLVAAGKTNREIADATGVSIDRVRACVRNVLRKLGVRNRVEATRRIAEVSQPFVQPKFSEPETSVGAPEVPRLSPREEEVVGHMARGRTNPQIAELTGLSPETVKAYLKSAFGKLGVHNRVEATVMLSNGQRLSRTGSKRSRKPYPNSGTGVVLTPGEVEVLRELATGKTNPEIALNTGLSRNTVKTYLQITFRKLQVGNRIEAITKAKEYGLLE